MTVGVVHLSPRDGGGGVGCRGWGGLRVEGFGPDGGLPSWVSEVLLSPLQYSPPRHNPDRVEVVGG